MREHRVGVLLRQHKLVLLRGDRTDTVVFKLTGIPGGQCMQPVLMKVDAIHINAVSAKRVEVAVA